MLKLKTGGNMAEILRGCGKFEDLGLWWEEDSTEREREQLIQDGLRKEKVRLVMGKKGT